MGRNGSKGIRYNEEFKKQILQLYEMGKTVSELCDEYGLSRTTIYKWIKNNKPIGIIEGKEITQKEYERMKKEILELKMENEILKKATAIFAKKQQ
jgi:transposase